MTTTDEINAAFEKSLNEWLDEGNPVDPRTARFFFLEGGAFGAAAASQTKEIYSETDTTNIVVPNSVHN